MSPQETRRILPHADTALLCIHGILGTPAHFYFLRPAVPACWSVVNLLLDGHGQGVEAFSATSMERWRAQVRREVDFLLTRHKRVVIAAHSMGTLLALETAMAHPDRIAGLFLMAVPLLPAPRLRAFTNAVRVGFTWGNQQLPEVAAAKQAYSIRPDRRLWLYAGWIPRYEELFRLIGHIRRRLDTLTTPTVAIQSDEDELVSSRSCRYLARLPAVTLYRLPHSGHHRYSPVDRQTVLNLFSRFCRRMQEEEKP